jgi:outer membrane protein OmpA-like peptidoglycan-associated protein
MLNIKFIFTALFSIIQCVSFHSFAQSANASEKISDCDGAMSILEPGSFSIQFTGKSGVVSELTAYPSLNEKQEKNSVWASFVAPHNGTLLIDATLKEGNLNMIVFKSEGNDPCGEIKRGIAEIKRIIDAKLGQDLGLSYAVDGTHLYPLTLTKGENILICFNTQAKGKPIVHTTIDFEPMTQVAASSLEAKLVDQRKKQTDKSLKIEFRDADSGNPLVGRLNLAAGKDPNIQYTGSDFYFSIEKVGKYIIRVDVPGYFFVDREEPITCISDHEVVIYLEKLEAGKQLDIEGIEFLQGTSDFMPSADLKLKRLKDFLALNSTIKVEIGGHVQASGDNSYGAQKLSEGRARRVVKYLIENGIESGRLTWKGYGNSAPIYPDAKLEWQEQANRRVEVKII